jgi:cell volume regulation protein A
VVAVLGAATLSWIRLPRPGLYPVATVAVAGIAYGAADTLHGSGFLAVYLAGLIIGDVPSAGKHASAVFHDSVAWVAQIGVFVMFGLLAFPSRLGAVAPQAIVIALVLVFVARPLATVVATAGQHFSLAERAVLSWAGLRGAAPMVFATYPVAAHMRGSTDLFDTVFFVVVISTLLQGATFEPLAHRLGLTSVATVQADAEGLAAAKSVEYAVTGMDGVVGRRVRDLVLVPGSTLVSIVRADAVLPLAMATRLMAGDTLHFLVHEEIAGRVDDLLACLRDPVLRQRPIGY